MSVHVGYHLLLELAGCEASTLNDAEGMAAHISEAIERAGLTELKRVSHRFVPQGLTLVVLLAESHVAVHTWPERGVAAVDLFTCAEREPAERALRHFAQALGARQVELRCIERSARSLVSVAG
ncbi:MAG: adenosylmethionine decarboxylase [Deltaproteobacteria bacterium]|nr:adenosylmethionine decarboxylase [Deltaproteobacteria bacterium]